MPRPADGAHTNCTFRVLARTIERDNQVHFLASMLDDNVGVELEPSFGDTLHYHAATNFVGSRCRPCHLLAIRKQLSDQCLQGFASNTFFS